MKYSKGKWQYKANLKISEMKDKILHRIWDHIATDINSMANEYGVIEDQKLSKIYDLVIEDLCNTLNNEKLAL